VRHSARSCRQVCLRTNRAPEDSCSASRWTSTVSRYITRWHSCKTDRFSFYEGHTMDLVTFATRVCKVLGVETMIGMLEVTRLFNKRSDCVWSYQCSGWSEPNLPRRRHRMSQRCTSKPKKNVCAKLTSAALIHGWISWCSPSTGTQHRGVWCSLPTTLGCIRP
jgi:hypothetical protein